MSMLVINGPTIAAGQSLSGIVAVNSGGIYRVIMPQAWTTAADITFQLSYNGTDFYNVYDRDGAEIKMTCVPKSIVAIGEYLFYIHSLRIRSGTARQPIVQKDAATFKVVLDTKASLDPGIEFRE